MQPYGKNVANQQTSWPQDPNEVEQLALFFSAQRMTADAADELVLRETQKTFGVYQEVIAASKTETQLHMLEIAALRERLATKESQIKELEAVHAAEKKAIQERSAEETAALKKSLKKSKKQTKALNKIAKTQVKDWERSLDSPGELTPETRRHCTQIYTTLKEKYEKPIDKK